MKQILAIALLILCITAKKHHKQGPRKVLDCIMDKCISEYSECIYDYYCTNTLFEKCDQQFQLLNYLKSHTIDNLVECTADQELASAFAHCAKNNCASFQQVMKNFNERK